MGMCEIDHDIQPLIIGADCAKLMLRTALYYKDVKASIERMIPNPVDNYERCVIKYDDRRGYYVHVCTTSPNMIYGDEGTYLVYYRIKSRCLRLFSIFNMAHMEHIQNPNAEAIKEKLLNGSLGKVIHTSEITFMRTVQVADKLVKATLMLAGVPSEGDD